MTHVHTDVDKGWVESNGQPRWRSTVAARNRIMGADLLLSVFPKPRRTHVIHFRDGRRVATLRYFAGSRKWLLNMEGFQFWHFNRVLGYELFTPGEAFDNVKEAHTFIKKVLADSEACFTPQVTR